MINYETLFVMPPFGLRQSDKDDLYKQAVMELSRHHYEHCEAYKKLSKVLGLGRPLPVRLFKKYELLSIDKEKIVKTMTSSGTTGQAVSKIYLDRENSARQTKVLAKIVSDFTGKARMPMLIIDSTAVLKNRDMFSARGAGILGFSILGRDITYALDEKMNLNLQAIEDFCQKHTGEKILVFGFTFMIWEHFYLALKKRGISFSLNGVMIHGGGWKKLRDLSVDNETFKNEIRSAAGIDQVLNYYGMVEQTGSIFMECEYGHLHASIFSDISIRNPLDFSELPSGKGLIQCTSLLPTSYPGHVLLTEDEGELLGVDDCPCGRLGKYFKVHGRVKGAEIRGCSDTYERR
ncbi:acyl-protein synthetase, LuxE [Desulfosporosinus acididurans]|uniref:Acyl-protein synthetase, LuxE n=1 Tax=Desulfosporosinus acididurans TaxID=476652 RepID=A0A0J1FRB7_9FIRM|nr:acyl-protein synthetase [Desulfosporosinus acididurans]KLU65862.1 acyl-protein synthetase, LuxE [Desulfosporosinus acididurans]